MAKRIAAWGIVVLFLLLSTAACLLLDLRRYAVTPAAGSDSEPRVVTVQAGQGLRAVTRRLQAADLIRHPLKFRALARIEGLDKRLMAGEYLLSAAMPPAAILQRLVEGRVVQHRLTIPEGFTLRQIAAAAAAAGLTDEKAFVEAAATPEAASSRGLAAGSLEGYLFPDTYLFTRGTAPEAMVDVMVARFRAVFTPQWRRRAAEVGLTVHEVVTLASIIEKETGVPDERPLISSVFHNRLRRGMRLESDPTVIYGLAAFNGNLTRKHLTTETPYNTYRIQGLPPGPIASPGAASLEAALYPADTDFLFFVARKDRSHYFSVTLGEHNRAVRKFQLSN
jgi:UPF0755 protein